ncbi:MAG: hypothetical protein ACRCSU_04935 [Paracoccaceae bacterium]
MEEDRDRIEAEARWKANTDADISTLKSQVGWILKGFMALGAWLGVKILDVLGGGIFK